MNTEAEELAKDCKMLRPFMTSELPPGWTREVDLDHKIVYFDHINNETVYEHPMTKEYRQKFHKMYKMQHEKRTQNVSVEGLTSNSH